MKLLLIILPLFILSGCKNQTSNDPHASDDHSFFVGTYTADDSEGIYKYSLDKKGHLKPTGLAAKTQNPSFLTLSANRKYLLAVNETSDEKGMGSVESYRIFDDSLSFTSSSSSGGANPCYLSSNKKGYIIVANYTGGNVGLLKLNADGELSDILDVQQHYGQGTTDRQKGPHAHSARFDPVSYMIVSADLGTNELWLSKIDRGGKKLRPAKPQLISLAAGAGPRHIEFHPNGNFLYVINELNNTISLMKKDGKELYILESSVSTLPLDYSGESHCADIHISSDGKFLYASNRGHNSIAIFKVNSKNGKLIPAGHQTVHGDWPRNFALSPNEDFLLVANQKSGNIVSFKRDEKTGLLEYISQTPAPNPVCILFYN